MIITLTSDFGTSDSYVGQIKGVILGIAGGVRLVDLTHEVRPQDVAAGAWVLAEAVDCFPAGTVHLAVVDPGVGGGRAAVAVAGGGQYFVGPDNGLFSMVLAKRPVSAAVRLNNETYHRRPVSATFHGRDIFAPAAAHLAAGTPLHALGEPIEELVTLRWQEPVRESNRLVVHVVYVDRFGNLITDLTEDVYHDWSRQSCQEGSVVVRVGEVTIRGISRTFSGVGSGGPVAYLGSSGRLEVAVRDGHAARVLHAGVGMSLYVAGSVERAGEPGEPGGR